MPSYNVLIAPDSFKESLDAIKVAKSIEKGWGKVFPKSKTMICPLSDGGEGFLDALSFNIRLDYRYAIVTDLTGNKRKIKYGWIPKQKTAVIETASIVGLHLVPKKDRKPELFTSYGVGEAILHAIQRGAKQVVLGLGGSGVNDGGAGIAQALGYLLLDAYQKPIGKGPLELQHISHIRKSEHYDKIKNIPITIASDVKNPYYGPQGATFVYGPQKGITPELCPVIDNALKKFAHIIKKELNIDIQKQPGSGAAGGMGGALFAFANGKFISGFQWIAQVSHLEEKLASVNFVITGEGQLDNQSFSGKVVGEMLCLAHAKDKTIIVLVGKLGKGWEACSSLGKVSIFPISAGELSQEELMKNTAVNLTRTTEQIARLLYYNLQ